MHLTVLAEPACPNAPVLEDRLAAVLDNRAGISVSRHVISDEIEAARWGMHGSPHLADRRGGPVRRAGAAAELVLPAVPR